MLSEVTIVGTAHNEASNVSDYINLILELRKYFSVAFDFVFVSNGSEDNTFEDARLKTQGVNKCRVVENEFAGGYGDGLKRALFECNTQYIFIIPTDLQYSLQDCIQVLEQFSLAKNLSQSLAILTFRIKRFDSNWAKFRGRLWRIYVNHVFNLPKYFDPASQLKILPLDLALLCKSRNFIWDVESAVRLARLGVTVNFVDVSLHKRKKGSSSLPRQMFASEKLALKSIRQLKRQFYSENCQL